MHPPIVLLTDFGLKDPYVGMMKGVILSVMPAARIMDLTHGISPGNILQAATVLENSVDYFPRGSVFAAVVDPGVGSTRKAIAVKTRTHYLVGPDNGLFVPLIACTGPCEIREIANKKYWRTDEPSATFHGRDIFAPVAAYLAKHPNSFRRLGPQQTHLVPLPATPVRRTAKYLEGEILYFDHFGNAITNLTKREVQKLSPRNVLVSVGHWRNIGIRRTYHLAARDKLTAIYNSTNHLELAWPMKNAEKMARLKLGEKVRVKPHG